MKKLVFLAIPFVLALLGFGVTSAERHYLSSVEKMPQIGGPFTLSAPDGRVVTNSRFHGKLIILYFGYTHCVDACPQDLGNLATALDIMEQKARDVAPLFITVDPDHDTGQVLDHYMRRFGPRFIGLTGTQAQIDRVTEEYHVSLAGLAGKDSVNTLEHSSLFYLLGKQGKFLTVIDGVQEPGDIAATLLKADS